MTYKLLYSFSRNKQQIKKLVDNPVFSQFWNAYSSKKSDDPKDYIKRYQENRISPTEECKKMINRQATFIKNICQSLKQPWQIKDIYDEFQQTIPEEVDVVIIGGGIMGSSIAFWLKKQIYEHMKIVVIEKDPTYSKASTTLSVGGLRQQFSLKENIEMSVYGAEFLRNVNEYLGIPGEDPVDVHFHPYGYLTLATEEDAETLTKISNFQNSLGANNVVLTANKLKDMFPWLNTNGIAVGCLGLEKEGWFDPWSLLCAFKKKAISLGVEYVTAEAKAFHARQSNVHAGSDQLVSEETEDSEKKLSSIGSVIIETPEGELKSIRFAVVIIAAGAFSAEITKMAQIGTGEGVMSIELPVEPRKRYVYCIHCPDGPGLNTPLTIDPSGVYFRREGLGGNYICGRSPNHDDEPPIGNLDVDENYFYEKVWPNLANRVKNFENLKLKSSWAGYYEYNTFDENGIIGKHPFHRNVILATGFSGHGIQHAPAVGLAIAELIQHSKYVTIDLSRLGFERFVAKQPMMEANIV